MAVHSLISVENLNSVCVKSFEFAEIRFFLFLPLCDCRSAAPITKLEASHKA